MAPEILEIKSPYRGFSPTEVAQLATKLGMPNQMAQWSDAAEIPVPSVVNWKLGHYAAIIGKEAGKYRVKDLTFGFDNLVSAEAIRAEASGYFLSPIATVLKQKQTQAGEDSLLEWLEALAVSVREGRQVGILRRVFAKRYSVKEASRAEPVKVHEPGVVQNPHDPEAQWSAKGHGKATPARSFRSELGLSALPTTLSAAARHDRSKLRLHRALTMSVRGFCTATALSAGATCEPNRFA